MKPCITAGVDQGYLSQAEGMDLAKAYDNFLKDTGSPATARALVLELVQAELDQRKRISFLANERRMAIEKELDAFRDNLGQADLPFAWRLMHDKMGHEGTFKPNPEATAKLREAGEL
jgi:hypothetical protein